MYPSDYRYTKEHEWIKVSGDTGTIGITDYAQHELGDVVFVELPAVGAKIKTGTVFGTVESVKAVSEIYAPVSGEVIEVNAALANTPEILNTDPHGAAWLIKIKLANPAEVSGLMDAAAYQAFVSEKRKPRPDALSPEESSRTPGNAGGHRRAIHRRVCFVDSREIPPARSAASSRADVRSRRSSIIFARARRKIPSATRVFWARASTTTCVRWSPIR